MFKEKPMPKCPYCGLEMNYHFDYPMQYCDVQFYCKHCNAMSPSARGSEASTESVEKTTEEAYEKAMRLYEEPNRILTIAEIKTYKGYTWKYLEEQSSTTSLNDVAQVREMVGFRKEEDIVST